MGIPFSVGFINKSQNDGDVCVFQTPPGVGMPTAVSLAWLAAPAPVNQTVVFNWDTDVMFAWAGTGPLAPGVVFSPAQVLKADLTTSNEVKLLYESNSGIYQFAGQTAGPHPGTLYVQCAPTVPVNSPIAIGVGTSGSPTFAINAQPNFLFSFPSQVEYWIAFGTFQTGQVLDVGAMSIAPARLPFSPGFNSFMVTLNPDNTFTIVPSAQASA